MGRAVVLVLRALHLGDLLVAVPALRALRRAFPQHRVVLAAPAVLAPVVELTGAVDDLLDTPAPAELRWPGPAPAAAVNLHGTGPASHDALDRTRPAHRIGFRSAGWPGPEWDDVARLHPHERERWCALLAGHGLAADPDDLRLRAPGPASRAPGRGLVPPGPERAGGAAVLVHPGAAYGAKRWPAERFGRVAAALHRSGRPVLVTGSAAERPLAHRVADIAGLPARRVLAGRTDMGRLCTLVAGAGLVVSGDTGIAHLASAFAVPSVVLFGPVGPEQWGPPARGPHVVLTDAAARRGDPFADDPDPALLAVGTGEVLRAAATVLGGATGRSGSGSSRAVGTASDAGWGR